MKDHKKTLRALIDASKLSIVDLAEASGIKRSSLNNMLTEGSRNRASLWVVRKVIVGITRRAAELASVAADASADLMAAEERIREELV